LEHEELATLRAWLDESADHRRFWTQAMEDNARIHAALRDVVLPEELIERVRKSLTAGQSAEGTTTLLELDAETETASNLPAASRARPTSAAQPQQNRHRWRVWAAAAMTLCAAILVYVSWNASRFASPVNPSALALCQAALAWIQQAESTPWPINPLASGEDQPFVPKQIARKLIYTGYGPTDCYLTTFANGRRIFQFVFRVQQEMGLPDRLPDNPDLPSQYYACSAYQQGDHVYVVAVEGDANDYRRALQSGVPVTRARPKPLTDAGLLRESPRFADQISASLIRTVRNSLIRQYSTALAQY
jgi:hypothetical protein